MFLIKALLEAVTGRDRHRWGPPARLHRVEGRDKVTGRALYAAEYPVAGVAHAVALQATIAKGEVLSVDAAAARALPGVISVLRYKRPPSGPAGEPGVDELEAGELDDTGGLWLDGELRAQLSPQVAYRGQVIGAVVATSLEVARHAAALVRVEYAEQPHRVDLELDDSTLYRPRRLMGLYEPDTEHGDFDAAFAAAPIKIDRRYRTPAHHNGPMEPHATTAVWKRRDLTLYDANQGTLLVHLAIAAALRRPLDRVRVIAQHVGGGFGQKSLARPHTILAALAARRARRPVKLAVARQQMFSFLGYRTPTIQRVRLGAGADGRLTAIGHDVVAQTSAIHEFAEPAAVATRVMYAAPNRRTTHRLARLDVPTPSWMRSPGGAAGMFALESAMDELAIACGLDPVELRVRNEPEVDPETGAPFSSRGLVACLREGARRFGWEPRDPTPGVRREGRWLVGTGVAASTDPVHRIPSTATARAHRDGTFTVRINATDVGQGSRTALTVIAAEALGVRAARVRVEIGDSRLPPAWFAGAALGTASWGTAVDRVCRKLRVALERRDLVRLKTGFKASFAGREELEVSAGAGAALDAFFDASEEALEVFSSHAFGAQFVEVRVDADTGEVRVPRMVGVFAAGRIINAPTARSQLAGGMIMGLSMALHEEGAMDSRFGDYANHDLASYHVASCADIGDVDVSWVDEKDLHVNPIGVKGVGEIGIVGTAAAIANAVHHATGVRVRDLPIRLEKLLEHISPDTGARHNGRRRMEAGVAAWVGAGWTSADGSPRDGRS